MLKACKREANSSFSVLLWKRLGGNGLHRRQRIVDAMEKFADEQIALFLGLFAVR